MNVGEFVRASGWSEYTVRIELAANRIPHRRVGHRGLIKILRGPALALLQSIGTVVESEHAESAHVRVADGASVP